MMCNYIFQNVLMLIFGFTFWYFLMRKETFFYKPDKSKSNIYNGIDSWTNTQGWIFLIFLPILVIISLIEKWAPITILLQSISINICLK